MIIQENLEINGKQFIRTYSDAGYMIHGGSPEGDYMEAIDPIGIERTYTETDIVIDAEDSDAEEILDILLGGEEE